MLAAAKISPLKINGMPWDGANGFIRSDLGQTIKDAMLRSGDPIAAAAALLADPVFSAIEPPDVDGTVVAFDGSARIGPINLGKIDNSYAPRWGHVVLQHVILQRLAMDITFVDRDVAADDLIAAFRITGDEILRARHGNVSEINAFMRSGQQVLTVSFAVQDE
jgi:hypothetical protein